MTSKQITMRVFLMALVIAATATVGSSQVASASPAGPADTVAVVADRVAVADLVAAGKWGTASPIHDETRAQTVINAAVAQASTYRLDRAYVRRVFADQVAAGESVQYGLFSRWSLTPPRSPARPSLAEIRDRLNMLTPRLLSRLASDPVLDSPTCRRSLAGLAFRESITRRWDRLHSIAVAKAAASLCRQGTR